MFEVTVAESRGPAWLDTRSRAALTGSLLVHAALALVLFNMALPQTARRVERSIMPVYIPVTIARTSLAAAVQRRALPPFPFPRASGTILPPPPELIAPAPPPEPLRITLPEAVRSPLSPFEQMPMPEAPPTPAKTNVTRPQVVPTIGSFDSSAPPVRPRVFNAAVVQVGRLEQPGPAGKNPSGRVAVVSTGFGAATAGSRPRVDAARGAPVSGGFGSAEATAPRAVSAPVAKTEFSSMAAQPVSATKLTPLSDGSSALEILDKPRPAYSEEARTVKLEGVVLLEMSFSAAGEARVLRVLHGLGHGLDESAMKAARGIRFRPALEHGRPIDTVASVRIEFQLAY